MKDNETSATSGGISVRACCVLQQTASTPAIRSSAGDASVAADCVLVFLFSRESDNWAQWRADYSRAIDRLLSREN